MEEFRLRCGCSFPIIDGAPYFDVNNLPDCQSVWDFISTGRVKGGFQIEKHLGRDWCKKIQPRNLEELSAVIAIIRPGVIKAIIDEENNVTMADKYVRVKNGTDAPFIIHDCITHIFEKTYSISLYQEQSLQIAKVVAGFNLQEADQLRRCLHPDTQFVSKNRGYVKISELINSGYENELFLVMDENGKTSWKTISRIWESGEKEVYEITSRSGFKILCSGNHKILTPFGWEMAANLKNGQRVNTINQVEFDGFDCISRDLAIVIAGIVTEGHFVEKQSTFVNHCPDTMNTFRHAFENIFGKQSSSKNSKVFSIRKEHRDKLSQYINFGLSNSRRLPDVMMGLSLDTTRDFLSFMFAAEGGIVKSNGTVEFSSKSRELIGQVKALLLRFGIHGNILIKKVKGRNDLYYRLFIQNKNAQKIFFKELVYHINRSRFECTIDSIEKKLANFTTDVIPSKIVREMMSEYPKLFRSSGRFYNKSVSRTKMLDIAITSGDQYWIDYFNGRTRFEEIESVRKIGRTNLYDFSMSDETEPYIIANGFVVHNSIGKKQADEMSKVRKLFIIGAAKVGKVNEEEANYIFDLIEKSERYSFNKCITGEAIIEDDYNNLSVEDRFNIYHDREYAARLGYEKVHDQWVKDGYFGYAHSLKPDGTFIKNIVRHIEYQGRKSVYHINLEKGYSIIATSTHKFPTTNGVRRVKHLSLADKLFIKYGTESKNLKIEAINLVPERLKVYDVEMEAPYHNFVANGIVTNNSHSINYAYIAYQTMYFKTHFASEFFLNYLKTARLHAKPTEEMKDKVDDAKMFNIQVLPPKLSAVKQGFHFDGEDIRFGLVDIKGIGEVQLNKIRRELDKVEACYNLKIEDFPWFQFLALASDCIPSNILEAFIRLGVMDFFGLPRNQMEYEYRIWRKVSDSVKDWIIKKHTEFSDLAAAMKAATPIQKEGGACKTKKTSATMESLVELLLNPPYNLIDTAGYVAKYEEEYLGTAITCLGVDLDNEIVNISCKEIADGSKSKFMCLGVIVTQVTEYVTKKGKTPGQKMGKISVMDNSGSLDNILVFPEVWKSSEVLLKGGAPIVLQVEKGYNDTWVAKKVFDAN